MPPLIDDRYQLNEVVASGGMATVWKAWDTRLGREVAIKRPHPTAPDDPRSDRMLGEARAASAIAHPNVVTIFDVGEDDDGVFLVMELVDGPTLDEAAATMSPGQLISVGSQVSDALAAIHASGIVHRDVKPSNILMAPSGPQLTDFGIALHPKAERQTRPGTALVTPEYAAPEVLQGAEATPESDVYSLALLLRELIVGQSSEKGDTWLADHPGLGHLLEQALSSHPGDRPTANELAEGLQQLNVTRQMTVPGGSTIPMEVSPPLQSVTKVTTGPSTPRSYLWIPALAVGLVVLGAVLYAAFNADAESGLAPATTTLTSTSTSSTSPATTTTTASPIDPVVAARNELDSILASIHPSDLKPKEAKKIMEMVDDAIKRADKGDLDEAQKKLEEASREINDKLDDEARDESLAALESLASALGVEITGDD